MKIKQCVFGVVRGLPLVSLTRVQHLVLRHYKRYHLVALLVLYHHFTIQTNSKCCTLYSTVSRCSVKMYEYNNRQKKTFSKPNICLFCLFVPWPAMFLTDVCHFNVFLQNKMQLYGSSRHLASVKKEILAHILCGCIIIYFIINNNDKHKLT